MGQNPQCQKPNLKTKLKSLLAKQLHQLECINENVIPKFPIQLFIGIKKIITRKCLNLPRDAKSFGNIMIRCLSTYTIKLFKLSNIECLS